jgi:hypothetical protein
MHRLIRDLLYNNTLNNSLCNMKLWVDSECWIGKDVEGSRHGLYSVTLCVRPPIHTQFGLLTDLKAKLSQFALPLSFLIHAQINRQASSLYCWVTHVTCYVLQLKLKDRRVSYRPTGQTIGRPAAPHTSVLPFSLQLCRPNGRLNCVCMGAHRNKSCTNGTHISKSKKVKVFL